MMPIAATAKVRFNLLAPLLATWWVIFSVHPNWMLNVAPPISAGEPTAVEFAQLEFGRGWDSGAANQQRISEFAIGGSLRREFHRRALGWSELRHQEEYPGMAGPAAVRLARIWRAWLAEGASPNNAPRALVGASAGAIFWTLWYADAIGQPRGDAINGRGARTCPNGLSYTNARGDSDGCSGAPTGTPNNVTLFQRTNFYSNYAPQSGQSYATKITSWNMPGIDYPVGIPGGTVFRDIATLSQTGCTYTAGPPGLYNCVNAANPSFTNVDATGRLVGSHGCVATIMNAGGSGTLSATNSYFCNDTNSIYGPIGSINGPGDLPYVIHNVVCDGGAPTVTRSNDCFAYGQGSFDLEYSAIQNISGRPIAGNSVGADTQKYNYIDSYVFNGSQGHAEFEINGARGTHPALVLWEYNTNIEGAAADSGSFTSLFYPNSGSGGTWNDVEILNNLGIVNVGNTGVRGGYGLTFINETRVTLLIEDNYIDSTGSFFQFAVGGATCRNPITLARNINLVTGGAATFSQNGSNPGC